MCIVSFLKPICTFVKNKYFSNFVNSTTKFYFRRQMNVSRGIEKNLVFIMKFSHFCAVCIYVDVVFIDDI